MYLVEMHDGDTINARWGSLCLRAKEVDHVYQAEANIQQQFKDDQSLTRAYLWRHDELEAVFFRSSDNSFYYVTRTPSYSGKWVLPWAYPRANKLVTGQWGRDVKTMEAATMWASRQLKGDVATAILTRNGRVCAAFELLEKPQLVALCPQTER